MRFYKFFVSIFLLSALLSGCLSVPDYPDAPQIEYFDIKSTPTVDQNTGGYKDSVRISIKYKDGDGDLGVSTEEIAEGAPYNFVVKQQRKVNGQFIDFVHPAGIENQISGHFFPIYSEKPGPIEGIIHYTGVQILHGYYPFAKDTIRFEVYIKDRAGNISNTVTTEPVMVRYI